MISAEQFLAILEEKDLLPPKVLEGLRRQVGQSSRPVPASAIAKSLIDKGYLTRVLANRLLGAESEQGATAGGRAAPAESGPEEELGLAPPEAQQTTPRTAAARSQPVEKPKAKPAEKAPPGPSTKARTAGTAPSAPRSSAAAKPAETAGPQRDESARPQETPAQRSLLEEELGSMDDGLGGGSLDGLMAAASLDATMAGSPLMPVTRKKGLARFFRRSKKKAPKKEQRWDSPLMLVGGGSLLLLVILLPVLVWRLTRASGDEMLSLANADYQKGSYTQAIHKFDQYLESFPKHGGVSTARVKRGLAELRQVTEGSRNWPQALKTAEEVLATIATETNFWQAHDELASVLPTIAEGLANDARKSPEAVRVDQARQALALTEKYVPKSRLPAVKLADVEASLALTMRQITRQQELEKTVAGMQEAVRQNKAHEAYPLRAALLKQYAELADNEQLRQAVMAVAEAQKTAVRMVAEEQAATTAEAASQGPVLVLARSVAKTPVAGMEKQAVLAAAAGAVYGLDAGTGKVLWRRWIGFDTKVQGMPFPPTPLSMTPGADALVADPVRQEVLRVEAATGQLRWRAAIGERFDAHPVVAGDRLLVATASGRLLLVDLESGRSRGHLQLPQGLVVAPAADSRLGLVFQAAEHSNLYVLDLARGACREVVYLGHEAGSITVPPVVLAGQYLVVAINDRARDAVLHILSIEPQAEGGPMCKPAQQLRLKGRIDMPPLAAGRRLLVATDQGSVALLEIGGGIEAKEPLQPVAQGTTTSAANMVRFPVMHAGQLWIADAALTKYEIQTARQRLVFRWASDDQSIFLQAPLATDQAVFHVRRREGVPGVFVAATALEEPNRLWETHVGAPLARAPLAGSRDGNIVAVTTSGALFRLESDAVQGQSYLDQPLLAMEPSEYRYPVVDVLPLDNGLMVLAPGAGAPQIAVFDPVDPKRYRWLRLRDPLACAPIVFGGGLLVAAKSGPIALLDARAGTAKAEPFQPRLESGASFDWRTAAAGENQVVAADGHKKLYLLAVQNEPKPHLAAVAEVDTEPIAASPAVSGSIVYTVDSSGTLTAYELPKLAKGQQWSLGSRCAWGPHRAGEHVLLASEEGTVLCMDAHQKRVWQAALEYGPPVGAPLAAGDHYLLATARGVVVRLDAASGKETGKFEIGRPLATGPVEAGGGLLVGGHDGTLYRIDKSL